MNTVSTQPQKRVAVYIRTKGECSEQNISYQLTLAYVKGLVEKNHALAHVDVYTDEGCSSFSLQCREGFNRMISDALNGMIDMIIVKSISRFSLNIEEAVTVIRQLREKGVEVIFEQEGFSTAGGKGDALIAFLDGLSTTLDEKREGDISDE